mmetsp:Transcript_56538/g.112420  ORF Transcript_56538/g.112420 Transcript_56538/m.112420 type:complete len:263 (+) Transcript_56538:47-835(+)
MEPPAWFLERLAVMPAAQAVMAVICTAGDGLSSKELQARVAAAARGAASGMGSYSNVADDRDAISSLDDTLMALRGVMGCENVPGVPEAKSWLRSHGGSSAANSLGKLSSCRNGQAHSHGRKIVAEAKRLAAKGKDDEQQKVIEGMAVAVAELKDEKKHMKTGKDVEILVEAVTAAKAKAQEADNCRLYVVQSTKLEQEFKDIAYRRSKQLEDRAGQTAQWGAKIAGSDERDGWIKVGDMYLPQALKARDGTMNQILWPEIT